MHTPNTRFRTCLVLAAIAAGSALSFSTLAAESDAQARYRSERAYCMSGQSQQDQATCLKEAGAALQENRRNNLTTEPRRERAQNAETRCDVLRGDDRSACEARMAGQGTTSGSVAGGGIIREITTTKPAQ